MARVIDADELLKDNTWEWFDEWGNYTLAGQAIADAQTVDAVEVVRCKDCLLRDDPYDMGGCRWCVKLKRYTLDNDFCSHGFRHAEKMDGGDKE